MTKTCPDCKATVLSTSQPERELTRSELIAEGIKRANESGMTMLLNQAKVIQLHLHEAGYSIVPLAATSAVGGKITDTMIEAGARIHNPFAFDGDTSMPLHRAQSRDEARKEVRAILSAALAATPAVDRARLINAIDSPTVEALARVWTMRSDKSCSEQIVEILAPLLCRPAAPAVGGEVAAWRVEWIDGMLSFSVSEPWNDPSTIKSITPLYAAPPASQLRGRESISQDAATIAQTAHVIINQLTKECEKLRDEITHLAAQPASPLRGMREALLKAQKIIERDFPYGQTAIDIRNALAASASPPAQPASPLRERESDMLAALKNVQKIISEGALTGFNYKDGDWAERLFESQQVTSAAIRKATAFASPPAQPAAYPIAEADEAHADLLRRLAAVPKEEKE